MAGTAWYLEDRLIETQTISVAGRTLHVSDGDSFAIGTKKLRLNGIDAPEYRQTCTNPAGSLWACGKSARLALEKMLSAPGLACTVTARDRYARGVATCSTSHVADIAAAHVAGGMAVSDEYYGLRTYGAEQDAAETARRGIWAGEFIQPAQWRELHASS